MKSINKEKMHEQLKSMYNIAHTYTHAYEP